MAGPIRIAILANGRQARAEIDRTSGSLGRLGRLARGGLAVAGIGGLAYGVASVGKAAISAEAQFSTSMRLIQAATKAPESAMGRLSDLAVELGNKTQFSASEAADAMLELAKAGIDTKTIMGGALAGTLQLAAAGGTDLGTAATIASNALNTFNLRGQDMASVAAALAGGANASSASVESLGQALQQVGPGATNAGLSLQETVAALSAFDAAGIKGSDAGTSLKTMLQRLVPTTAKAADEMDRLGLKFTDANGEFLSLTQISQELQREFQGLSAAERTKALATVFGSDATRAATVLMKQGSAGIRDYIKATNDQNAAQEMANARMEGTAGALERLSGAAETAALRLGQEMAPATEATADFLADNMGPALEGTISTVKDFGSALEPVGSALLSLGRLAGDALGFLGDMPDGLRTIAIEAAAAALVLPRLGAAAATMGGSFTTSIAKLQQFRAELTYTATRTQALASVTSRLGTAARTAAGVGGMVALAEGAKRAGTATGDLLNILGGAATGFAVGGLVGAAVGGLGGAFLSLKQHADAANEAARVGQGNWQDYASSLDGVTAASTEATRAMVVQNLTASGAITTLAGYGISARTAANAALGMKGASREVNAALRAEDGVIRNLRGEYAKRQAAAADYTNAQAREVAGTQEQRDALKKSIQTREAALAGIRNEIGEVDKAVAAKRREIAATRDYSGALKGLPKLARTEIQANGVEPTLQAVATLAKRYALTPKQVRTLVDAVGIDATVKDVDRVKKSLTDVSRTRADLGTFKGTLTKDLQQSKALAAGGAEQISGALKDGTGRARPDLGGFSSSLRGQIGSMEGTARAGGTSVGNALGQGVVGGIGNYVGAAASAAANLVANAVAAARRQGKIQSPSRETQAIGEYMGDGLVLGLNRRQRMARDAGRALAREAVRGAQMDAGRASWVQARTQDGKLTVAVQAPPVQVFLDGREVRHVARREANRVVNAQLDHDNLMGGRR